MLSFCLDKECHSVVMIVIVGYMGLVRHENMFATANINVNVFNRVLVYVSNNRNKQTNLL